MLKRHTNKTTARRAAAALMLAAMISAAIPALANAPGSLWSDSSDSLFVDGKARFLGDVVTIIVSEKTIGTNGSTTGVSQSEKMDSGTGTGIIGQFLEAFGIESKDEYSGKGTTSSNNSLTTTITAVVAEVLENGNLVIEARRSMVVNEETQTMVFSGVVRPKDISGDNTIISSRIANAQIRYTGRGPIAKRQRPGILNKLFDWIF